jgi:hypothetical protein
MHICHVNSHVISRVWMGRLVPPIGEHNAMHTLVCWAGGGSVARVSMSSQRVSSIRGLCN